MLPKSSKEKGEHNPTWESMGRAMEVELNMVYRYSRKRSASI
jgi:hypothetical protein